jgi:hypothetical protein
VLNLPLLVIKLYSEFYKVLETNLNSFGGFNQKLCIKQKEKRRKEKKERTSRTGPAQPNGFRLHGAPHLSLFSH